MSALAVPARTNYHPKVLERFNGDIDQHQMTVLHDDGLYRHIRFRAPGTSNYWFDLLASPGILTIRGDMGTYTFARETDMIDWFHGTYVNAGYWGEKLQSIDKNCGYKEHSGDVFKRIVMEHFWQHREYYEPAEAKTIWQRIKDNILDDYVDRGSSEACHELLAYFDAGDIKFRFSESWDWGPFEDYSYQYLWCCHAILWGVQQYKAAKAAAA